MAGHNKWSQIKHKKAATDSKRSQLFGKLAKRIATEAKKAGAVETPGLRSAIERARAMDMPKENIERAIDKGQKGGESELEEILYELYGPGGCALLIDVVTDSRNRTGQELRHLLGELGYSLATPGAAQWAFIKSGEGWKSEMPLTLSSDDQTKLEELLEALGGHDDIQEVYTNVSP